MTAELVAEAGAAPEAPARGRQVWRRLRADHMAMAGLVVAIAAIVAAIAAPLLIHLEGQDTTAYHSGLLDSARGGVPLGSFGGVSGRHWLGVEPTTGRDLFARALDGARISFLVAFGTLVVQILLGVGIGLAAGLGGKVADAVLGRLTDLAISFPQLIFAIALLAIVPGTFPRPMLLMLVIGLFGWGGTARLVRGQVLSLKTRDYVAAARLSGASRTRIALREILPGVSAPLVTYAALLLPSNMISEAGLSFLGVGVRPPASSWGQMLSTATTWFQADPTYVLVPGLLLLVNVLAFTVLADGLRTALDPKARSLRGGRR
ncbi:MAG: binding-protein-dependent transporter inner rane component [Actinoallomurus sp.]|nr:binding-protein-dependent transporter inner rane component [Actinoallomurus sp.]